MINVAKFDTEFFFLLLLPPIIFEAGYNMQRRKFFSNIGAVCMYAFVGTLVSTVLIAGVVYLVSQSTGTGGIFAATAAEEPFNGLEAAIFGALISATDPVTVLAVFGAMGADLNLFSMVFGESVLNDAVAIVLYRTLDDFNPSRCGHGFEMVCPSRSTEEQCLVSRAFPSWKRSILTEIYLCHACSCQEIEDRNARTGARGGWLDGLRVGRVVMPAGRLCRDRADGAAGGGELLRDLHRVDLHRVDHRVVLRAAVQAHQDVRGRLPAHRDGLAGAPCVCSGCHWCSAEGSASASDVPLSRCVGGQVLFPYMAWMLAEACLLSGIVSVLFCGILMAHYTTHNLHPATEEFSRRFFKTCAFMSESFVFIYMGLATFTYHLRVIIATIRTLE
jgi:hypothetical protein